MQYPKTVFFAELSSFLRQSSGWDPFCAGADPAHLLKRAIDYRHAQRSQSLARVTVPPVSVRAGSPPTEASLLKRALENVLVSGV